MDNKVIAVDAMGGDNAPSEIIRGSVSGSNKYNASICLVGDENIITQELSKYQYDKNKITIKHASEVIKGTDIPTEALKNKKDSSMIVGLNMVKRGDASAIVSAGNTGALMAGATVIIGRIKGIDRPALGVTLPHKSGFYFLIDAGANADVKPHYLVQFATMGSVYIENTLGIAKPRVGLVNIGIESNKGSELYREAHALLQSSHLNFIGNIEGTEIPAGTADVLVCDGFTGNIILKYSEGLSSSLFKLIKDELTKTLLSKMASGLLKSSFKKIKESFDASDYGGAPLLGLKGLVVKAHGSSDAIAIENAIKQCTRFIETNITQKLIDSFQM